MSRRIIPVSPDGSIYLEVDAMPEPREVLLLHPLARGEFERATMLLFAPSAAGQKVRIRLVGVPVDGLLDGTVKRWWPLPAAASVSPRVCSGADQRGAG